MAYDQTRKKYVSLMKKKSLDGEIFHASRRSLEVSGDRSAEVYRYEDKEETRINI